MKSMSSRIFLLSPAKAGGPRYDMLLRQKAEFDLARKLRQGGASIGKVYSFISSLYFRGKMRYIEAFARAFNGLPPVLVIVPGAGLVPPDTAESIEQLRATSKIPILETNAAFREPLKSGAKLIDEYAGTNCSYVLLGSIANGKYTTPLLEIFGERLLFPIDFVGRGDMSRGGLLLQHARSGIELPYGPVLGGTLRGARAPRIGRRST